MTLLGVPAGLRFVAASKLAEFRVDKTVSEDAGLGSSLEADKRRNDRRNYSAAGQRLYGWFQLISICQVACWLGAMIWIAFAVF